MEKRKRVEEMDRESNIRTNYPKTIGIIITIIAAGLGLFHLYTSYAGSLVDIKQRSIHLYTLMLLGFMLYPLMKKGSKNKIPFYDYFI